MKATRSSVAFTPSTNLMGAMELFAGYLAVLPLFRGMTPLQIAAIARCAGHVSYTPGAMIIEENGVAETAILIVAGTAARVSGPELVTRFEPVLPGALLGEAAMLVETTYGSTVVARTEVRTVHITRDILHQLMLADPGIADCVVQNLVARLAKLCEDLQTVDAILGRGEVEAPAIHASAA